jgi:hypothetical protein
MLPIKALSVLATLKAELLSPKVEEVSDSKALKPIKKKEAKRQFRKYRGPDAVQRSCQRKEWWTPVYIILLFLSSAKVLSTRH